MKTILKLDELEQNGWWSCYYSKRVTSVWNMWYTPARALGLEPADYVQMVIDKFHPDKIIYSDKPEHLLVLFKWKKQSDMRVFKNWINKQFRDRKFYIEV